MESAQRVCKENYPIEWRENPNYKREKVPKEKVVKQRRRGSVLLIDAFGFERHIGAMIERALVNFCRGF